MNFADQLRDRTLRNALDIIAFSRGLPDSWDVREVGRQLLRAGTSVAANYRSACRARSHREFVARLGITVEEADETLFWLTIILRSGLASGPVLEKLLNEAGEILAILSKSHRTARENRQRLNR